MNQTAVVTQWDESRFENISAALATTGFDAIRVESANELMRFVSSAAPAAIVLDWNLADMSGIELVRRLRAAPRTRHLPIIFISERVGEYDVVAALDAGADDYILYPFSPLELSARIRSVVRARQRESTLADPTAGIGLMVDAGNCHLSANGKALSLTMTEFRLFSYLVSSVGRVRGRRDIVSAVWGDQAQVDERTVDVTVRRIRKKLSEIGYQKAIRTVRTEGYVFSTRDRTRAHDSPCDPSP